MLGQAKTRLAKTLGDDRALEIYKTLCSIAAKSTTSPLLQRTIYYDRPPAVKNDIWTAEDLSFKVQSYGDLGDRMLKAFQEHDNGSPTIIIGTDCPFIDTSLIEATIEQLSQTDVVLGPTEDGGYYLIAMHHPHAALFQDIEWSTASVYQTTLDKCMQLGLTVGVLETYFDIDYAEDWERYVAMGLN